MARERWLVDGYELTLGAGLEVEYRAGLYAPPGPVGDNPRFPGVTGVMWVPKVHGPGHFVLSIFAEGVNRAAFEAQWDELLRQVCRPWELLRWERHLADGTVRYCDGEVVSDLGPTPIGQVATRASIEVGVPGGYFESPAAVIATPAGAGLPKTLVLSAFATATAPMETLVYTITGPITDPVIVDVTAGVDGPSFTYTGTVPDGAQLVIDAANWEITGVGFTPDMAGVAHTNVRYMLVRPPRVGQTPTVQLRGSGGGAGTALSVAGRARFLV